MFQRLSYLTLLCISPSQPYRSSYRNKFSVVRARHDYSRETILVRGSDPGVMRVDQITSGRRCPLRRVISGEEGGPGRRSK